MKLIIAIIRPEELATIQAAFNKQDVHLMTVSQVLDCCEDSASVEIYRGREVRRPATKLRLEIAVDDSLLDFAIEAIEQTSNFPVTSHSKAFVADLGGPIRVRSPERGTTMKRFVEEVNVPLVSHN